MADIKKSISTKKPPAVTTKTAPAKKIGAKPARAKPAPASTTSTPITPASDASGLSALSPEERYRLIEKEAYHRAEKRNFLGGHPAQDWLEAEAYIDNLLRKNKL